VEKLDFIYKRQSIRSFKDEMVGDADLQEIIKAATYAPSGKNQQNWHFVIVKGKEKVTALAGIVERKNAELAVFLSEDKAKALKGMVNYHTVFKKAPMVVLVYAGPYHTVADDLAEAKIMPAEQAAEYAKANPGIQNIAAAMENMLLAAASLGYGTCWMTGPTYAAKEITEFVGFNKPDFYLAALTPLGVPAEGKYSNPPRKPVSEIMTIVE
jgi:nitroreductase